MNDQRAPLSRFTVLDLTRVRSGPTAVRQLADWGANVIKIEPPEKIDKSKGMGGARHGPDFQNLHRNKRGLTLNLKEEAGRAAFMRMVKRADSRSTTSRADLKIRVLFTQAFQVSGRTDPTDCDRVSIRLLRGWVV